jgi:4-nitrophenyl phosphatase
MSDQPVAGVEASAVVNPDIALCALRGFIFDLDGTLYRGNAVLPGAAEFVANLRRAGVPHLFLTNNATTPPVGVAERLTRLGIMASADEVLTSAQATAAILAAEMPGSRVYMVGEAGIREALLAEGLELTEDFREADAVVVGMDREVTYARLRDAALAIRRGAPFIATNTDRTLPTEQGLIPGAGSLVGMLEIATDVRARVIGKPSPGIMLLALRRVGTRAGLTAVVGDRPETDIVGGQAAGLRTIGVLTGASPAQAFAALRPPADWVFDDMVELNRAYFAGRSVTDHAMATD